MKYNDNGTVKELKAKVYDTLPVGTIVDYDGNTIPSGWEEITENKLLSAVYVGSQILYNGASGTGAKALTHIWDAQGYRLINAPFYDMTMPTGYHREYRFSALLWAQHAGKIKFYLNSTFLFEGGTYSNSAYRFPFYSDFFTEDDLPQAACTTHPNNQGLNLKYQVTQETADSWQWEFQNLTVHCYLVKDEEEEA